ncbi:VOC family protein [Mucilaginibacter gotjawali]|uniref:Enzyme related to lactoylglutathione lyase n=2 Tax=Mucilaginibacter gotjawali TaxID=1550579 RepID=A0A839SPP1_9SPHI|nr:VOC family protein [Mucilaginibacter gotjawali]MBB3058449.1 putative enzyme related to lactoylglutathione lyase [Mucilaginibacter gotjawali]BAU53722.1 Glyoxalase-like domain protein [Mucilaginibacter gotjawali]
MKKFTLIAMFCTAFLLGYGFSRLTNPVNSGPRVTGIGGIFFKAKDPAALKAWYSKNLGIRMSDYGATFEWHQGMDSTKKGFTAWAPFKETTKYFQPSEKQFMINYRVEGLNQLLAQMKTAGILPVDSVEKTSYGNFVHLMDPEGNKIELWEPNDVEYAKMGSTTTK